MRGGPRYNRDGTMAMPEDLSKEEREAWAREMLYRRRCLFKGYYERGAGPCNLIGMSAKDILDSLGDDGDVLTPLELAVLCLRANDKAFADAVFDSAGVASKAQDVFDPEHVHEMDERLAGMGLLDKATGSIGVDYYALSEDAFRRIWG